MIAVLFYALFSVPDVIAGEFISEIHSACTESDEGDELAPLRKYLLQNRGWRCLAVLLLFRDLVSYFNISF